MQIRGIGIDFIVDQTLYGERITLGYTCFKLQIIVLQYWRRIDFQSQAGIQFDIRA